MIIEALREENHIQISGYESGLHMVLSFDPMINVKKMIKMINQKNLHLKRIDDYYDHRPKDCYDFMFEYAALSDTEISKTLKAIKESLHAM
jgi:DNA-binding transcriptional MocR family regulator